MTKVAFLQPVDEETQQSAIRSLSRLHRSTKIIPKMFKRESGAVALEFFKENPEASLFVFDNSADTLPEWVMNANIRLLNRPVPYSTTELCERVYRGPITPENTAVIADRRSVIPFFGPAVLGDLSFCKTEANAVKIFHSTMLPQENLVTFPSQDWKMWEERQIERIAAILAIPLNVEGRGNLSMLRATRTELEENLSKVSGNLPSLGKLRIAESGGQVIPLLLSHHNQLDWLESKFCQTHYFGVGEEPVEIDDEF